MISTAVGVLGWFGFLLSLPLVVLALVLTSANLFFVAIAGGALGLTLVVLALATKGLFALFHL